MRRPAKLITAKAYVSEYYDIRSPDSLSSDPRSRAEEEDVLSTFQALDGERLVNPEALKEAWEEEYRGCIAPWLSKAKATSQPSASTPIVQPLADLTVKPAVDHALKMGDASGVLQIMWLPGKKRLVKEALCSADAIPDGGIPLLVELLKEECSPSGLVDLSCFAHLLTPKQIAPVLLGIGREDGCHVDLSKFKNISIEDLQGLLTSVPAIKSLILFDTSITKESLLSFLEDQSNNTITRRLSFITHPAFIEPISPVITKHGFTFMAACAPMSGFGGGVSIVHSVSWTPTQVVSSLIKYTTAIMQNHTPEVVVQSIAGQAAFSAVEEGKGWGRRIVPYIASMPTEAIDAYGWFCFMMFGQYTSQPCCYAFARLVESKSNSVSDCTDGGEKGKFQILDVRGWVEEMVKEGRSAPPQDQVEQLDEMLNKIAKNGWVRPASESQDDLSGHDIMAQFMRGLGFAAPEPEQPAATGIEGQDEVGVTGLADEELLAEMVSWCERNSKRMLASKRAEGISGPRPDFIF
jgi:hypothetical protein